MLFLAATANATINGNTAELIAAVAAILALILSATAIWFVRHSEKRQLFIHLHDLLTSPDSQAGRRILHTRMKHPWQISLIFRVSPREFDLVNRTLGLYNTLGIYVHRGYVGRDEAFAHWAGPIKNSWPELERFLRWRRDNANGVRMWSYFVWLAQEVGADVPPDMRLHPGWEAEKPYS
ncbi:hypothetical protein ACLBXX_12995 [Microbacterium sp. C23T]